MADAKNKQAVLLENLQDAGCDCDLVKKCMECGNDAELKKMLPQLRKFRTCLLENIHKEQDKLESLDYLIYKLEQ